MKPAYFIWCHFSTGKGHEESGKWFLSVLTATLLVLVTLLQQQPLERSWWEGTQCFSLYYSKLWRGIILEKGLRSIYTSVIGYGEFPCAALWCTHTAYLICCVLTQCIVTSIYNLSCFFSWHIARLYHMRRKVLEDKSCYCTIWNSHTQRKAKEAGMNFFNAGEDFMIYLGYLLRQSSCRQLQMDKTLTWLEGPFLTFLDYQTAWKRVPGRIRNDVRTQFTEN